MQSLKNAIEKLDFHEIVDLSDFDYKQSTVSALGKAIVKKRKLTPRNKRIAS